MAFFELLKATAAATLLALVSTVSVAQSHRSPDDHRLQAERFAEAVASHARTSAIWKACNAILPNHFPSLSEGLLNLSEPLELIQKSDALDIYDEARRAAAKGRRKCDQPTLNRHVDATLGLIRLFADTVSQRQAERSDMRRAGTAPLAAKKRMTAGLID